MSSAISLLSLLSDSDTNCKSGKTLHLGTDCYSTFSQMKKKKLKKISKPFFLSWSCTICSNNSKPIKKKRVCSVRKWKENRSTCVGIWSGRACIGRGRTRSHNHRTCNTHGIEIGVVMLVGLIWCLSYSCFWSVPYTYRTEQSGEEEEWILGCSDHGHTAKTHKTCSTIFLYLYIYIILAVCNKYWNKFRCSRARNVI